MLWWNSCKDWGKIVATMGRMQFWLNYSSNFSSVARFPPNVNCLFLFEQSYLYTGWICMYANSYTIYTCVLLNLSIDLYVFPLTRGSRGTPFFQTCVFMLSFWYTNWYTTFSIVNWLSLKMRYWVICILLLSVKGGTHYVRCDDMSLSPNFVINTNWYIQIGVTYKMVYMNEYNIQICIYKVIYNRMNLCIQICILC